MRLPVDYNNGCRPTMSWGNFVWGDEDEDDDQDITLPSWTSVKGKDPLPSSSVQKRFKRVKNVSSHKRFSQKTVSDVWRTTATSSSDSSARSGPSSQDQMLEFPSLEVYRKSSPVASEPKENERKNTIPCAENVELVEQEVSIEPPVPAAKKNRKCRKTRDKMYLLEASLAQEQQMRTKLETDSNNKNMCKLEDRQQLTTEPPVTPTPAPQPEHSASDVSVTTPGASEGNMKKKNRISAFAENVELVEQEVTIEPPVPADPTPPSEEPTIKDPQNVENNMENPEHPDVSSTPSAVSTNKKKCWRASDKMYLLEASLAKEQQMRTKLETDSNNKNMCKLEDRLQLTPEPPVTLTPAPQPEHSASDVSVTTPGASEGNMKKKNRISAFAENVELVEQEVIIEPPVPADPAPPSEEPTIKDPQNVENNMENPEHPDVSSTPSAVTTNKKKCWRASDKMYLLEASLAQEQQMRTKLETDSNNKNMCKLEDRQQLTPEPPVTATPAPQPEHSASDVSVTSPGAAEGNMKKKNRIWNQQLWMQRMWKTTWRTLSILMCPVHLLQCLIRKMKMKIRISFAENVELVEQEVTIEPPVPADPTPPSDEPTIKDPQNVENNMDNPEHPDVSSTPSAVSKNKKKCWRASDKMYLLQSSLPQEQQMRTKLETDSNNKNMCKLEDRQQLTPEPPVTPTPAPQPEHSASDVSVTSPGASEGNMKKKNRISAFAENVELVEQEVTIEPPVPADPAPPSDEPTIKDPQNVENNMENPEHPDVSSTPSAVSTNKKKCWRASDKMYLLQSSLPQEQQMRTKLETDSNNKNMCKLEDRLQLTPEPPVTLTPAPQPEHSASDVSITSPGASEGNMKKKNRISAFAENVELVEQEVTIEPPVPADPTPPSEEPTIKDPQNVENNMENPEHPDVSSTPSAVTMNKKKCWRASDKMYLLQASLPKEQLMRTKLETDSNNKNMCKLEDRQQLTPEPPVTPTPAPQPEHSASDVSVTTPGASEGNMKKKNRISAFAENVELVEQEVTIEPPVPADPAPPSEEPTIKDPQNVENNMENPEHPDVSSTPSAVSKNKKKCWRASDKMYLLQSSLPQEQQMRTKVETDSNNKNMCKLEDRQQLTPEPPVTPTPAPQPEHSASDVSVTSPGASEGNMKKKNRISAFAENVELVEQEVTIEPPVPADPAPPSEEPTIKDPQNVENNMENPEHPDVSSTPSAVSTNKKKCCRARDKMYLLQSSLAQEQLMRTKLETDSNNKNMCKLEDRQQLTPEPPVTPTPAPQPEHSASDVSITSPGASEGNMKKKNRISAFAENVELVEQEVIIEPPVPADPAPPSEEPTIKDPQNVENNMENPEHPDVSSTPSAVSTNKKKCWRASDKMYLLEASLAQEQQMRTKLETDSNNKNMCKLADRQQLTPEPPVTPTPAPQPEHSASDVSVTSPGAAEGNMKKKNRIWNQQLWMQRMWKTTWRTLSILMCPVHLLQCLIRKMKMKIRISAFAENVELVEQEVTIEPPVPADPTPPSDEPTIKDPQNVENNMENPEHPDVSSTPSAVSKNKKKCWRASDKMYLLQSSLPQEQQMRTKLETDSNNKNMCKLEDRQQLTPEPPVTPTPAPQPEHSASDVSVTSPRVSERNMKKKNRISAFAENVELVEQEVTIEPPVPADPAPPSDEPKIEDPQKKPEDPALPDWSSTPPGASKSSKKKKRRRKNKICFPPMQEISSTLETDSSNKDQVMLLVTPTPAPVSEHHLDSSYSQINGKEEMRSSSSVKELCRLLDGLHLSR
ncbi:msx2-interacting protein-like isoform X3 [Triplophysa dalaica]|uniref:msx2-interacting protein-like isoform X3 n=1 Tax=Triplophysa dalaica TaxID=1582913 RepID=UPI0024DF8BB0|nr:msx2-interacting protein-like isoform X3 [Triplophysa dalaica]